MKKLLHRILEFIIKNQKVIMSIAFELMLGILMSFLVTRFIIV